MMEWQCGYCSCMECFEAKVLELIRTYMCTNKRFERLRESYPT